MQPAAAHVRAEQGGQPLQVRLRGQLRRYGRGGGGVTNAWSATCLVGRRVEGCTPRVQLGVGAAHGAQTTYILSVRKGGEAKAFVMYVTFLHVK